jgi:lysophospholipase L1-like esterase
MKSSFLRLIGLLALSAVASAQEKPFYLKENDRVLFYGDSITDQRLYTTFTETFVVTRFPKLHVDFVHSGWGGDRVSGGGGGGIDLRLQRDVFAYKPTVMTIMLGMNDGSYRALDERIFEKYRSGYEHIVDSLKEHAPGLRLTLIEPSPYDDVNQAPSFEGGYNKVLIRYGEFVKELAQRDHQNVADLNTGVVAALEKAKATDPEQARKIIPDRVHPGAAGHLLMAGELLKAWNAPRGVTSVEIDGAEKRVRRSEATKVSDLKASAGTLSWAQLDEALPMAVDLKDPVVGLALKSSDFVEALDQEVLKVTGLPEAKYKLNIDGATIGEFTGEQLAQGINLATLPTPMLEQAREVHRLTLDHNNIHFSRWRQIQVPMANFKSDGVQTATKNLMSALDEEEAAVVHKQRAAAQPVERHYELSPQ